MPEDDVETIPRKFGKQKFPAVLVENRGGLGEFARTVDKNFLSQLGDSPKLDINLATQIRGPDVVEKIIVEHLTQSLGQTGVQTCLRQLLPTSDKEYAHTLLALAVGDGFATMIGMPQYYKSRKSASTL